MKLNAKMATNTTKEKEEVGFCKPVKTMVLVTLVSNKSCLISGSRNTM